MTDQAAPPMPQPTAEHTLLMDHVGNWKIACKFFMEPGQPPMEAQATESVEKVGEFWTLSKYQCDMMGMPFVGTGCLGYDPYKERYVGTWIDSLTTELAVMTGEMDLDGNTLIMRWTARDPDSGVPTPNRVETTFNGDSYTSNFFQGSGDGTKVMTLAMKRTAAHN